MKINNKIYNDLGCDWWDENGNGNLVSLRYLTNPVRFKYIKDVIKNHIDHPEDGNVLDVGCGGGYLAEELAREGLDVTGLDPSRNSIIAAKAHGVQEKLTIKYVNGWGEALPFESNSFHFACCCDVLEHVEDFSLLIKEISRVLKDGGVLFYETINRTFISKMVMIKILQEWEPVSFLEPDIHIWGMFIKPKELIKVLSRYGLANRQIRGLSPSTRFISHLLNLRALKKGDISWQELGKKMNVAVRRNISCNYIGHAVKSSIKE